MKRLFTLSILTLITSVLFTNLLSVSALAVEPFTFSPNPVKQGGKVTLDLHPFLHTLLQGPATKNAPKYVYLNGKFLYPTVLYGGRMLVVTIPKNAKSGYLELTCKQYRWQTKKKLIVSASPAVSPILWAQMDRGAVSKVMVSKVALDAINRTPQITLQVQPEQVKVPYYKNGKMKDFNVDIRINHSVKEMTFKVRGQLPPGKKFGGKYYDFDIEIEGNRSHGQQTASITRYNPPNWAQPRLRLRRRFGNGLKIFKYTIEVRVKDSNGLVGSRTVEVVMKKS